MRVFTYKLNNKTVGYIEKDDTMYYAYYGKKSSSHYLVHKGTLEETTKKIDDHFIWKLGLFKVAKIKISA